jgi:hypothetical protein
MTMIGLNRQFDKLPLVFGHTLMNNLPKALFHRSSKGSTPILWTKNQMRNKSVDPMPVVLIFHPLSFFFCLSACLAFSIRL